MNKDYITKLIQWNEISKKLRKTLDTIEPIIGLDSIIFEAIFDSYGAYTNELAYTIKDTDNFLEWFMWENELGAKEFEAGLSGNLNPIKNLDDLINLLNEVYKDEDEDRK